MGKGFRDAPRDALLAESVEKKEIGKSFGYQRAMDTIGAVLGPLFAVLILPLIAYDYRLLFLIAFFIGALAIASLFFVRESRIAKQKLDFDAKQIAPPKLTFSLKQFDRNFKLFILAVFVFGLGAMPLSLMLLKSQDIGAVGKFVPLMYLVYNISFAIFAIPFGKLSDKIGQRKVMIAGFSSAILSYLILASSSATAGIVLGFVIFGLYSAMTDAVERALASKLSRSELLASGQGFLSAAAGLSSLLAGLIGGVIWTFAGSTAAFIYGAVLMSAGLVVLVGQRNNSQN